MDNNSCPLFVVAPHNKDVIYRIANSVRNGLRLRASIAIYCYHQTGDEIYLKNFWDKIYIPSCN